jgi:hypothetical protein
MNVNTVEFLEKNRVCAGNYRYSFLVNGEELTFHIVCFYNDDTGMKLGWMFTDFGGDDAGGYQETKSEAIYSMCWYLLTRHWVKSLGFCGGTHATVEQVQALNEIVSA